MLTTETTLEQRHRVVYAEEEAAAVQESVTAPSYSTASFLSRSSTSSVSIKQKKRVNFLQLPEEATTSSRQWRQRRHRRHSSLPAYTAEARVVQEPPEPRHATQTAREQYAERTYSSGSSSGEQNDADELVTLCSERARDGLAAIRALHRHLSRESFSEEWAHTLDDTLEEKLSELSLAATRCAALVRRRKGESSSSNKGGEAGSSKSSSEASSSLKSHSFFGGGSATVTRGEEKHRRKSSTDESSRTALLKTEHQVSQSDRSLTTTRPKGRTRAREVEDQLMMDMALTRCPSYRIRTLHVDTPDSPVSTTLHKEPLSPLPPPPGPPPPILPVDIPGDENHPVVLHSLRQHRRRRNQASPASSSGHTGYSDLEPPSTASSLDDFDYDDFNAVDIPEYPAVVKNRSRQNSTTSSANTSTVGDDGTASVLCDDDDDPSGDVND